MRGVEISDTCKEIVADITSILDRYNIDLELRQWIAMPFVATYQKGIGADIDAVFGIMKIDKNENIADIIIHSYLLGRLDQQSKPGELSPELRQQVSYGLEIDRTQRIHKIGPYANKKG